MHKFSSVPSPRQDRGPGAAAGWEGPQPRAPALIQPGMGWRTKKRRRWEGRRASRRLTKGDGRRPMACKAKRRRPNARQRRHTHSQSQSSRFHMPTSQKHAKANNNGDFEECVTVLTLSAGQRHCSCPQRCRDMELKCGALPEAARYELGRPTDPRYFQSMNPAIAVLFL